MTMAAAYRTDAANQAGQLSLAPRACHIMVAGKIYWRIS
jgi:hypothetical protein